MLTFQKKFNKGHLEFRQGEFKIKALEGYLAQYIVIPGSVSETESSLLLFPLKIMTKLLELLPT